jgi:transposase-like protein
MFTPPFCPRASCTHHTKPPASRWWFREGHHLTKAFGKVPRFRCKGCGLTFSVQTFRVTYYAKRIIALRRLERLSASSMSTRALSREFRCSCGTISNRIDRIARQGIMLHTTLRPLADPHEAVCFDGLVNFDRSQFFPNDIGISITGNSRFILGLSHATTRRAGTMREDQREKRDLLYEGLGFERKAVERSFTEHLDLIARERPPTPDAPLILITDEKQEYGRALEGHQLYKEQDAGSRCVHMTVNSELPRTYLNPLFPSNYIDREVRKDQANFRRETTCFSWKGADCMSRLVSWAVWHNYDKRYLIKAPVLRTETHAEVAGIPRALVRSMRRRMFTRRAFLSHLDLAPIDRKLWTKTVYSPWEGKDVGAALPRFALG